MKCIILAAGRGSRMGHLTRNTPKPLLKINKDEAIIDNIINNLPDIISEIGVVVGYLGEKIINHLKNKHPLKEIHFFFQEKNRGTADALSLVKKWINKNENFLVLLSDNIYHRNDLNNLINSKNSIGLIRKKLTSQRNHTLIKNNFVLDIQPIQKNQKEVIFSIGAYYLSWNFFSYKQFLNHAGELSLPHTLIKSKDLYLGIFFKTWRSFNTKEDLENYKNG